MQDRPRTMRFRASPVLALKSIDELPAAFAELSREYAGVLVSPTATAKSVDRETAELFRALATTQTLEVTDDLIDLVLDGVLVVDDLGALLDPRPADLGRLAREALAHAEELESADVAELTNALYSYNRLPRTRAWMARFPDRKAVLAHLGDLSAFERNWVRSEETWISWSPAAPALSKAAAATLQSYKLYVSPKPEFIRDAFGALIRVLPKNAALKIGPDAGGLLRPDKLMVYFTDKEQLDATAHSLAAELRGCPAHGVPFTAPYDDDALLSWGADPPQADRALSWLDRESWRLYVAKSLASAMSLAKHAAIPATPFAVERVRRLGIDIETWTA